MYLAIGDIHNKEIMELTHLEYNPAVRTCIKLHMHVHVHAGTCTMYMYMYMNVNNTGTVHEYRQSQGNGFIKLTVLKVLT